MKVSMLDRSSASVKASVWESKRLQQMRQQVIWRAIRLLGQNPAASADHALDLGSEKIQCPANSYPAQARDEVGHAKNIERADFSDGVEIDGHRDPDLLPVRSESVRKDGAL